MSKNIKTIKSSDGFYYPYTSPDIVVDSTGENQTTKNNNMKTEIQTIKDNQINLVEDDTSMEGISDTEYDRNADTLRSSGLGVIIDPWSAQIFQYK